MKKSIIILLLFPLFIHAQEKGRAINGGIQIDVGKIDTLYFASDTLYLTEDGRLFKTEIITSGSDGYVSSLTWTDGTNVLTANDPVNGAKTATITGFVEDGDFSHDWDFSADDFTLRTVTDGGVIRFRNDPDGSSLSTRSATSNYVYFKLEGDTDSPGNSKYYGTNTSGTKGWYDEYTFNIYAGVTNRTINRGDLIYYRPDTESSIQPSITESPTNQYNVFFKLTNDATTPGNSKYYGTNVSGAKGWYDLPSGTSLWERSGGFIKPINIGDFLQIGNSSNLSNFTLYGNIDLYRSFPYIALYDTDTGIDDWIISGNGGTFAVNLNNTGNPKIELINDGSMYLIDYGDGTFSGTAAYNLEVNAGGKIIETTAGSDFRMKKNFRTLHNSLDKILKLNTYAFDWIPNEELPKKAEDKPFDIKVTQDYNQRESAGVIAQEIKQIIPEAVKQYNNGYYKVDYEVIVPHLIEAIKEQQKQIENLQKQINELN